MAFTAVPSQNCDLGFVHDKNSDDAFGIYISGEINDLFACRCWLGLKQIVWQSGTIWI